MHFTLEFNMDNAEFNNNPNLEAANTLIDIAGQLREQGTTDSTIHDINGHHIGQWRITD